MSQTAPISSPSTSTVPQQPTNSATPRERFISPQITSYFIAGGAAGAASRTVVSPLERLKIIHRNVDADRQYRGVWRSLVRMWKEEGFAGLMRGNGINCVRIVPYSAVQFTTYEQLKKWFTNYGTRELDTPTRLISGALAGITSVCTTYPLDLVRSRLSIATASIMIPPPAATTQIPQTSVQPTLASGFHTAAIQLPKSLSMWGMTKKVMIEEGGVRALYKGMIPTAVGVAPYVGINFAAYELFRGIITPPEKSTVSRKLACGALAGSISQTLTYPFDVLRRKMQVSGMQTSALGYQYNGAFDALRSILRHEGVPGLYRGLWPNLLKVAPSIAVSFFTYETVKEFLGV